VTASTQQLKREKEIGKKQKFVYASVWLVFLWW